MRASRGNQATQCSSGEWPATRITTSAIFGLSHICRASVEGSLRSVPLRFKRSKFAKRWPATARTANVRDIQMTEETLWPRLPQLLNFFVACETGKGWEACRAYCSPNATFVAQAEPLAGVKTLAEYTDWMNGLMSLMADGSYELQAFATDTERNNVVAYAVFWSTPNGPVG